MMYGKWLMSGKSYGIGKEEWNGKKERQTEQTKDRDDGHGDGSAQGRALQVGAVCSGEKKHRQCDQAGARTLFSVGDEVVHRVHGAGIITEKKELQITETPHRYLVIDMPESDSTLMVPTDKAEQRLRPVSKMTTLRHLLTDTLTGQPNKLPKDYKERREQINKKLKSGEIRKWIEVVRDLTHRREQGRKSKIDRRLLKRAMHLLTAELALARGIDPEKAESRLAFIVEHPNEFKDQQVGTGWLRTLVQLVQRMMRPFTESETQATADAR
jgi:CarD family transcriptional regulator